MLGVAVQVEPLPELRDVPLTWYVGLDAEGTRIGDALWHGDPLDEATRSRVVSLFRMSFRAAPGTGADPVYLILGMGSDNVLRMKPQNLLVGLPAAHARVLA
jgi:hypothetical protein